MLRNVCVCLPFWVTCIIIADVGFVFSVVGIVMQRNWGSVIGLFLGIMANASLLLGVILKKKSFISTYLALNVIYVVITFITSIFAFSGVANLDNDYFESCQSGILSTKFCEITWVLIGVTYLLFCLLSLLFCLCAHGFHNELKSKEECSNAYHHQQNPQITINEINESNV